MSLPDSKKIPSSGSNFYNLEEGDNRIRVIQTTDGYLAWQDKKPIRKKTKEEFDGMTLDEQKYGEKIKYFWALIIYQNKEIKILEIIQPSIMRGLTKLEENEHWGDIRKYNINIMKTKEGSKTNYAVIAEPDNLTEEDKNKIENSKFNLDNIFKGKNPLNNSDDNLEYEEEPDIEDVEF